MCRHGGERRMTRPARFVTLALLSALTAAPAPGLPAAAAATDPEVGALLRDYIGLYTRDTLDAWRGLFHPSFVAAYTNDDGTTTARNLDEFVARQRHYFATGRPIREDLADVQV